MNILLISISFIPINLDLSKNGEMKMKKQILALFVVVSVILLSACGTTSVKNRIVYTESNIFSSFEVPEFLIVCESSEIFTIKGSSLPREDGEWAIKGSNPCNDNKSDLVLDVSAFDDDIIYVLYGYNIVYVVIQYKFSCSAKMYDNFTYVKSDAEGFVANEVVNGRSIKQVRNLCTADI